MVTGASGSAPTYVPLPSDYTITGAGGFYGEFDICNTLKTGGTSAGDWYIPLSNELTNYHAAYVNSTNNKYENKYSRGYSFLQLFVGNIATVNFELGKRVNMLQNYSLQYIEDGNAYRGNFEYSFPQYSILNNFININNDGTIQKIDGSDTYGDIVCITKIKI